MGEHRPGVPGRVRPRGRLAVIRPGLRLFLLRLLFLLLLPGRRRCPAFGRLVVGGLRRRRILRGVVSGLAGAGQLVLGVQRPVPADQGGDQGPGHCEPAGALAVGDAGPGPRPGLADLPGRQPGRPRLRASPAEPCWRYWPRIRDICTGVRPNSAAAVLPETPELGQRDDGQVPQAQVVLAVGGDGVVAAADLDHRAVARQVQPGGLHAGQLPRLVHARQPKPSNIIFNCFRHARVSRA